MKQHLKTGIQILSFLIIVGLITGGSFQPNPANGFTGKMIPDSFSDLAEKARPSVVNIRTVKTVKGKGQVFRHFNGNPFNERDPFHDFFAPFFRGNPMPDFKQRSLGSGFIIDSEGYIVTNNHVVENASEIKVKLAGGKELKAKIVGRDPNTDVALIKVPASRDLKPLQMGNSDSVKVGSWVVAIGSPFGLEQTVTAGIVSAKGRIIGSGPYDDFIQTDASINPGNSGGPLINLDGEVVGINTAIVAQGQGIGFAIPMNMAHRIVDQLKNEGEVTRGWLGVAIQNITPELAEYYGAKDLKGALVIEVYENDPAEKAGIRPKDVIVAVDGKPIESSRDLSRTIAESPVGKKITVTLIRKGEKKTVKVKLKKRDDNPQMADRRPNERTDELGLSVSAMTDEMAGRLGFGEDETGVIVTGVEPESKAQDAGLRQGDLIKEVNRAPVNSVKEFNRKVRDVGSGETIQFLVKRAGSGYIVIKLEK
jgi:serine protease Do